MKVVIDEETGLPQLPKGEIWVIEEHRILIKSAPTDKPWKLTDGLMVSHYKNHPDYEVRCERENYTPSQIKWFGKNKNTRKHPATKVRETWYVRRINVRDTLWEEGYGTYKTEVLGRYDQNLSTYVEKVLVESDPVTHENVIERCEAILAARAETEKREGLYGEYPPKRFDLESSTQGDTNAA